MVRRGVEPETEITCLYIDFDAFFASVEKQLRPELRARPVGVTALDSEYSSFITRCYMAKAAGIKRGMRVHEARASCPDLAVCVARPDIYVKIHNQIIDEIDRHVPVTKVWSIDEMECTLIGRERRQARALAGRIRAGLARNIGRYITPSIGIAPNQFLAKVAADMDKPNGLTVLRPQDLPGPLLTLALPDLPGISGNMEQRLLRAGIDSVEAFWNISAKQARAIWGNIEGERMWAQLRGYIVVRPETQKRMFGHSRVLTKGWSAPSRALKCLELLTVKAAYRLRRAGYLCAALTLSLRPKIGPRWSGDVRFKHCSDDRALLKHMHGVFARAIAHLGRGADLKSVSVMLTHIAKPQSLSGDLFDHADSQDNHRGAEHKAQSSQKWDKVMDAMDGLNKKHGKAIIHVGSRSDLPGGYAGGKIAFGRVPDEEDFY